ncbi:RDD family protein [Pseudonocardiaceae bacterium YIM PH 21723]|nr:RDD family protein [Pseudonocardiaceae bacterium YIM PH 21723]
MTPLAFPPYPVDAPTVQPVPGYELSATGVLVPGQSIVLPRTGEAQLAPLGSRFLARLIDTMLTAGVVFLLVGLLVALGDRPATNLLDTAIDVAAMLLVPLLLLGPFCYEVVMLAVGGATLGKRILGLTVLDLRTGSRPGIGQALGRSAMLLAARVFLPVGWLVDLSPVFDAELRQGWHDRAANTVVIAV